MNFLKVLHYDRKDSLFQIILLCANALQFLQIFIDLKSSIGDQKFPSRREKETEIYYNFFLKKIAIDYSDNFKSSDQKD